MANLYIIPARKGSKGLPGKNIKPLNGKPLILHSLEFARENASPNDIICLSSNDETAIELAKSAGFKVPFTRPEELSDDTTPTEDAIMHALHFYESLGNNIDKIILLQPTSPIRKSEDLTKMISLCDPQTHMVVSVMVSKANPYFNLFEENEDGFLESSKKNNYTRRQDVPEVYQYNGSIYVINADEFKKTGKIGQLNKIKKLLMAPEYSVDIDTEMDFLWCEWLLQNTIQHGF